MSEVTTQLSIIIQSLGKIDNEIAGIKSDIAEMKSDIAEMKSDISDLKETTETILEGQEEQSAILDTLTRNSIRHEGEIRRIKSIK